MLRNTMVALGVAAITAISFPVSASASTAEAPASTAPNSAAEYSGACVGVDSSNYANPSIVTSDKYLVDPGDTVTVTWHEGYFPSGSAVSVAVSGSGSSGAGISSPNAAGSGSGSLGTTADAAGGVVAKVTVPASAVGNYGISGSSGGTCGGVTVAVRTAALSNAVIAEPGALASTGGTFPTVLLLTGGGALLFGSILLVARSRARRQGHDA